MIRSLDIVIVTYNNETTIADCLALASAVPPDWRFVVVDNASHDCTVEVVQRRGPEVAIIAHNANQGFAAACNAGAAMGSGEAILFLNPDCQIDRTSVEKLLEAIDSPHVAAAGPLIISRSGRPLSCGEPFIGIRELAEKKIAVSRRWRRLRVPRGTTEVDWITGAAFMVRRSDFERIGGFDMRFWLYVEDMDMCWRLRQSARAIVVVPEATATHGHSHSTESNLSPALLSYCRGTLLWFRQRSGSGGAFAARLLLLVAMAEHAAVALLTKSRRWTALTAYAQAFTTLLLAREGPDSRHGR